MMPNKGEIDIHTAAAETVQTEARMEGETLRPSQKMMAELFDHASDTAGLHLKNIYAEQELEESVTAEFFSVVQIEGDKQ